MRCPNCNQWNRATLPRCIRCGTELSTDRPVEPSWRSQLKDSKAGKAYIRVDEDGEVDISPDDREVLAAEMMELKARKDDGQARLDQMKARAWQRNAPAAQRELPAEEAAPAPEEETHSARVSVSGLYDQEPAPETPAQEAPQPVARNPRGTRIVSAPAQWQDTRAYDPIVEDMRQNNVFKQPPNLHELPQTPSRRKRSRHAITVITTALILVVICLAAVIGVTAYQKYQEAYARDNGALVSASLLNDLAAHTILIPGEDGQIIYINELHDRYEVIGGFATIVIADHVWYDELDVVTDETMTVTLTPLLLTSPELLKPLAPIQYDISIPLSPIELVTPESLRTEVTTPMYSMHFKVRAGSTVKINGVDMSDAVDESGLLIYNATVQPIGDNVYNVEVRSPYCRNNSLAVTLYREVQEIPLDLAATTYTSTNEDKYQITCTTVPGAEIDILSPHSDLNITNLDTTGEFTFYAIFDKIGYNTVSIQASYPGKKTSQVDYVIYYLPNQDVYTRKAWDLGKPADYAELVGNISFRASRAQIYLAQGQVDHFVSESPQMAVFYCSVDGKSQPVLLENQTKTKWKEGVYYNIYADVYGSYNGMPWLVARYTYLQ